MLEVDQDEISCVCVGSGRFMIGEKVAVFQPRGNDLRQYIERQGGMEYEIDTVTVKGEVETVWQKIDGIGELASEDGKRRFLALSSRRGNRLRILAIGLTEAGLDPENATMKLIIQFIVNLFNQNFAKRLSVLNTDNVPGNGDLIERIISESSLIASLDTDLERFQNWMKDHIVFHNTMVDRITSKRDGEDFVPRAEPLPLKALVIEDLRSVLPSELGDIKGVFIRKNPGEIDNDYQLKLCVCNAIHTAIVYFMALSGMMLTTRIEEGGAILKFIRGLYKYDISNAFDCSLNGAADEVYEDWINRLCHPHFGLQTFFICQNATMKLKIRLFPAIMATVKAGRQPSSLMAFSVASLFRFITPEPSNSLPCPSVPNGFRGWFPLKNPALDDDFYGPKLRISHKEGYYEFVDGNGEIPSKIRFGIISISNIMSGIAKQLSGFNLAEKEIFDRFLHEVEQIYGVLTTREGSSFDVLMETLKKHENDCLDESSIADAVKVEVNHAKVIDLHTHLLPPHHGDLMLWGIDELLTYQYLVAEYFMTADDISPEAFFSKPKSRQAEMIWKKLFVEKSPLSEACRGVLKTMQLLGFHDIRRKGLDDLNRIRKFCGSFTSSQYSNMIFANARVRYNVMTNIPYEPAEAAQWVEKKGVADDNYRSALRVDVFLKNDWERVSKILEENGFQKSIEGAKRYLREWAEIMKPEYLMASTPHDFTFPEENPSQETQNLLEFVLIPIATELSLPIALKLGAQRGMNPRLKSGGDGVVEMDLQIIAYLCRKYPRVKFLATFLSRTDQHQACVLANKFSNLHLYGCWWYCNNPSIIKEMTEMRIEMLGTAFTAQHSDARVTDQLLYKWAHSRKVIGQVLIEQYKRLLEVWPVSRKEIENTVHLLFGGSYEHFMSKELF